MKQTVAAYVRVSTLEQAKEGYSVGEQIERLTNYSKAMNWALYKVYTDAGYSGASIERPALQELIEDAKAGKFDKVVVYKIDRLSRSQLDTLYLIEKVFLANKVDFVSMTENFSADTPFGRATLGVMAVFAQLERESIKERMTMGAEARAKEGKWRGGSVPYGYDYVDDKLIVNEYEAMIVKLIYAEFTGGKPLNQIDSFLIERGFKKRGKNFAISNIRYILSNKVYAGYIRHRQQWYQGTHEPILDESICDKAIELLELNKQRRKDFNVSLGNKAQTTYLGGLLYCARCGGKYCKRISGNPQKRLYSYVCYSRHKKVKEMIKDPNCKNKIYRIDELDKIIFDEIRKLAFDKEYMHTLRTNNGKDEENKKIRLLEAEIKNVENQISRFMDLYGLGRFTVDQLDAKLIPLEEQRNRLQDELGLIKADKCGLSEAEAIDVINSFSDILEKGNFQEIRQCIETLIDRIDIDGENISIHWRFL